ncbi:hypothetical protein C9F11_03225 [Streptomyces sp. YIM 121038]|uniref:hypothetical protein n=1 Tax=Streptomyces sp. YIM 121038 TaxID=2136401 RepID=UPI001164C4CF|nr:hypothetical protein [Streptomyces sp. YIM 121038]QCX74348.1 hypothetical protein C9F11_03225 [Streptomyces sp. YIM 121038]
MSIRAGVPSYAPSVRPSLVVAGLAVAASLLAGAPAHAGDGGGARAAAPLASPVPAPARTVVTEGQVKEAGPGGSLLYPSVTSCLTLTVQLRPGGAVGAHASLFQVPGELRSDQILDRIKAVAGGRAVTSVDVRGAVGAWHPGYFTKAIESYGEGEEVPVPTGQDAAGIAAAVARGLGVPTRLVTVTDVPDGDQIAEVPRIRSGGAPRS